MAESYEFEVAIVGSGFSGLASAAMLQDAGITDFVILERGDDVGGTWRDNSYPGCACDVPSHLYSFAFAPNPAWTSTFSSQTEIQDYLRRVASDRGLFAKVRLRSEVLKAAWDETDQQWRLETTSGRLTARVVIAAAGPLSEPSIPKVAGLDRFQGAIFHSARWDHAHDLTGERVAVIGTGASSIQFVPQIQPHVAELQLYQRTAAWIMPRRSRRLTRAERALYRRSPRAQRAMRGSIYWARETYAIPLIRAGLAPVTRRIATMNLARQVKDAQLRAKLTPSYAPGCKRILISDDYLPALTRPNVDVITEGITEVREHSIVTDDGTEREVDTIIFGTGFHVTDVPIAFRLFGKHGRSLREAWSEGMQAYAGTAVTGFPNLFLILGPNTGLGHTSVVLMAEWQAAYVLQALRHMRDEGVGELEVRAVAQTKWNEQVQRKMRRTVWLAGGCSSWYLDHRGRNTTLWPDFTFRFRRALRHFDPQSYDGRPLAKRDSKPHQQDTAAAA
jgi:cation diffusion facilitator CzcD-associated flavoprotein CzcO